jgi:hypothetical protein
MALAPTELVAAILDNPTDLDHVRSGGCAPRIRSNRK